MFLCKKFFRAAPPDAGIELLSADFLTVIAFLTVICLISEYILTPDYELSSQFYAV